MIKNYVLILLTLCLIACAPHSSLPKSVISQGSVSTQVRFEWLRTGDVGGFILLELGGPGLKGLWIVDTGASVNVVSDMLVSSKEYASSQTRIVQSATGEHKAKTVVLPEFKIGSWVFKNQLAVALDMSLYREKLGVDIQGILGVPVFSSNTLTINGPKRALTLSKAVDRVHRESSKGHFRMLKGVPVIDMQVSGKHLKSVILDTGNAGGLVIFPRFAAEEGLIKPKTDYLRHQAREMGGVVSAYLAKAETARIGDVQVENLVTAILGEGEKKQTDSLDVFSGSLGMAALEHLQVSLDFPAESVYFSTDIPSRELEGGWGIIFGENGLVIDSVLPLSPAHNSGLKQGDKVVLLDGDKVDVTAAEFWQKTHARKFIELTVESAQGIRKVSLKREYFLPSLNW